MAAFHVACPITCRKICYCTLGAPRHLQTPAGRDTFLQDVMALEALLSKPAFLAAGGEEMVDVLVPRLAKDLKPKKKKNVAGQSGWESGEESPLSLSKKAFMRKKVTMAAIAIAEAAALAEQAKKAAEAARGGAACQVICELCFSGEAIGSKKAERMVRCPGCKKPYHRNCLKSWSVNRDLFNWASWVCPSCRICEVCRRTGEPNKLMFCKRCDGAYHAYCQQPQLKQVPKRAFLCPKHVYCHSCGARIPGSGASSRWFLGYTTCDPCGRLFMKGKYCPVCLKVYRDSEASPMVCCDNCEHWVHCQCDGISDEKYREYQLDNRLHYKCAACRGDCYQVRDLDDATNELWRRRDGAERDLIAQLQASAGILSKEESLKFCPSDDEEDNPSIHAEDHARRPPKELPLKNKVKDGKSPKALASSFKKKDKVKSDTSENIKKLKITLTKPEKEMPKGPLTDAAEQKGFHMIQENGPHKTEKGHKQENELVKLKHQGNVKIQVRKQTAIDRRKDSTFPPSNKMIPKSQGLMATGCSVSGDTKTKKVKKYAEDHVNKLVKTVKFVSNAKSMRGTKVVLHFPFEEKEAKNKVKTKALPAIVLREDSSKDLRADDESSDSAEETHSEGQEEQEPVPQEDAAIAKKAQHNWYHGGDLKHVLTPQLKRGGISPVQSWGFHVESVKRRRIPSSKYREMDTNIRKLGKAVKDSHAMAERMYNMETRIGNKEHTVGESEPILDHRSGGPGTVSRVLAGKTRGEREKSFSNLPATLHEDALSSAPRKRLKVLNVWGRKQEVEEGREMEGTIRESSPKVSLKFKLKQVGEGIAQQSGSNWDSGKQQDGGNAILGKNSKRKRHRSERLMGQEQDEIKKRKIFRY